MQGSRRREATETVIKGLYSTECVVYLSERVSVVAERGRERKNEEASWLRSCDEETERENAVLPG